MQPEFSLYLINREKHYTYEKWRDINNYDLSINVDKLGVKQTAEMITEFVKNNENIFVSNDK